MARTLKRILLALLFSLLFGMALGTWLRLRLDRPPRGYIGRIDSAISAGPLHVVDARAAILDPRHHEEQVG